MLVMPELEPGNAELMNATTSSRTCTKPTIVSSLIFYDTHPRKFLLRLLSYCVSSTNKMQINIVLKKAFIFTFLKKIKINFFLYRIATVF